MRKNIGTVDKAIRITVGSLLVVYGIYSNSYLVIAIGAIPLITAFIGLCPLYAILGKSTCSIDDRECH